MALADLQSALALLTTDPAARALFLSDPQSFARQRSLASEELASLQQTAESSLELFSRSLLHKRAHEAARTFPQTRTALGESFRRHFEAYAASTPIQRDAAHDAIAFLGWLLRRLPSKTGAARQYARYERAWLQTRRSDCRVKLGVFSLPTMRTPFLAVWWRLSPAQPCRYFQWPRARR
jgi:hypothetical protein